MNLEQGIQRPRGPRRKGGVCPWTLVLPSGPRVCSQGKGVTALNSFCPILASLPGSPASYLATTELPLELPQGLYPGCRPPPVPPLPPPGPDKALSLVQPSASVPCLPCRPFLPGHWVSVPSPLLPPRSSPFGLFRTCSLPSEVCGAGCQFCPLLVSASVARSTAKWLPSWSRCPGVELAGW